MSLNQNRAMMLDVSPYIHAMMLDVSPYIHTMPLFLLQSGQLEHPT